MPTIRIIDRRYEAKALGGKNEWVRYDRLVTYPEGSKVRWDLNQHTVVIQSPAGDVLAAFTALHGVVRDDLVTVGQDDPHE